MNRTHRNLTLDNISGILILHMIIVVHAAVICGCNKHMLWWTLMKILCFFLPWFFYKSGMMFRLTDTIVSFLDTYKYVGTHNFMSRWRNSSIICCL